MKKFFYLSCFYLLPLLLSSQRVIESIGVYEQLFAKYYLRTHEGLDIDRNVREVTEKDKDGKMLFHYVFDENGRIISASEPSVSGWNGFTEYSYTYHPSTGSQLGALSQVSIKHRDDQQIYRFDQEGKITHASFFPDPDSEFRHASYNYKKNSEGLVTEVFIDYGEHNTKSPYVQLISFDYTFKFDDLGRLISERVVTNTSDGSSGYNVNHTYDGQGQRIAANHISDCLGSNSCLGLSYNFQYDEKGRLIGESCVDMTIRNSLWSYSYSRTYKWDDAGLLVAFGSTDLDMSGSQGRLPIQVTRYRYDLDAFGNWIRKWELRENSETLVSQRFIQY